jgi:hypothetical protein
MTKYFWDKFAAPLTSGVRHMDTRRCHIGDGEFIPEGRVYVVGEEGRAPNPIQETKGGQRAARLFVGLSVGQRPRWDVDDVIKIVRQVRTRQTGDPGASFIVQKGIFKGRGDKVVEEDSVQVVILDFGKSADKFKKDMGALAMVLVKKLKQEVVYVEMQRNGIRTSTLEATP